ncbi:hypothetical protein CCAX7_51690 [Capsulimonas corticalis]|uniref:Glycosyltransferase 2-like domain-containing protein n=1 Tax=Capsulimonas corticalis TaxID=2219043 RepID=A0A402CP68_9BACT|nr:glycosyltransferase [Capsulimonas corticalis]BDI33118.1 hypothetical protein CCAX7_51690 [Capsulimonas corticalis]
MKIAVCICTRNRPDDLRKALKSISASLTRPAQIIVSDDSDDNQAASTQSVCNEFAGVTYLRGPRRGLASNRNCCLDSLQGDIEAVTFIDDDAAYTPEFLGAAAAILSKSPTKTIVTGRERKNGQEISPGNVSFWGHQSVPILGSEDCRAIVINATLFPRALFSQARFDEALRYGYEEADIAAQAQAHGYRFEFAPDLFNDHFPSDINRAEYSRVIEASRLYSAYKRYRWLQKKPGKAAAFSVLAPLHLMLHALRTGKPANIRHARESVRTAFQYYRMEARRRSLSQSTVSPTTLARPKSASAETLTTSVVVPTYRRPSDLKRCLLALKTQTHPPTEILVVARPEDDDTLSFLRSEAAILPEVRVVPSYEIGQVAALNAGWEAAKGDIVAITDDDAAPRPQWLERVVSHFASDPSVGGVGGRDWVHERGAILDGSREVVGRVSWYGRVSGNHHLGVGPARDVEVLKGVNMSYRRSAAIHQRFDTRLRGTGAQSNNDMAFSLQLARSGWKLIYDPEVAVDHHASVRFDEDQRNQFNAVALSNIAHNETIALLDYLPGPRRIAFIVWSILVGTRVCPGLVQVLRLLPKEKALVISRCKASLSGRKTGRAAWRRSQSGVSEASA